MSVVCSHFYSYVDSLLDSQMFWYVRVQILLKYQLQPRLDVDWYTAYYCLSRSVGYDSVFCSCVQDLLSIQVLIEAGYDPSAERAGHNAPLIRAITDDCPEVVKLLLQDGRIDPNSRDSEALMIAYAMGKKEALQLILADKRVSKPEWM